MKFYLVLTASKKNVSLCLQSVLWLWGSEEPELAYSENI